MMSREEAIKSIACDQRIVLRHRIEFLQRIDAGEDHEEVRDEFKTFVQDGLENCHEDI